MVEANDETIEVCEPGGAAKGEIPVWESSDGTQIDRAQFAELEAKYGAARVCLHCRTTHFFENEAEARRCRCDACGRRLWTQAEIQQRAKRAKRRADKALSRLQGFAPSDGDNRHARRARLAQERRKG